MTGPGGFARTPSLWICVGREACVLCVAVQLLPTGCELELLLRQWVDFVVCGFTGKMAWAFVLGGSLL